jgi:hypothetical protein
VKTYYQLLQVAPDAPAAQIKQAFRQVIARYHPDKVQHLGAEFQELAQVRSAELTIAYKTLIDPDRRAEYDRSLLGQRAEPVAPGRPAASAPAPEPAPAGPLRGEATDTAFESLRSGRDALLKRAALSRLSRLFGQAFSASECPAVADFDLSCLSKPHLFGRSRSRPWLLAKFVSRLDGAVVHEVWAQAVRANAVHKAEVFVFVLTGDLAPQQELAAAIAANRQLADPGRRITIVPVDVRDWRAWIPKNAHPAVKSLAARLKET